MRESDIEYIVVHASATEMGDDIGFLEIDNMHLARGWKGCGYHFIIRIDGTIEIGRPINEMGAHVGSTGNNQNSWGICLVGGLKNGAPFETYSDDQFVSLKNIVCGLMLKAPNAEVLGHRDLSPDINGDGVIDPSEYLKQCPCFNVREWKYNEIG